MATSNPSIVGRTITGIRRLNDEECEQIWGMPASMYDMPLVIELDDGSELIPSSDPEECWGIVLLQLRRRGRNTYSSTRRIIEFNQMRVG